MGKCNLQLEGLPTSINVIKIKPPETHPKAHLQEDSKFCQAND